MQIQLPYVSALCSSPCPFQLLTIPLTSPTLDEAILAEEESTSGKPNHFDQVKSSVLPHSKYTVYYCTKYIEHYGVKGGTVNPHMQEEASFKDFAAGTDPFLELIKNSKD